MIVKDLLSQCTTDEIVTEIIHISGADENKREKLYSVHEKANGTCHKGFYYFRSIPCGRWEKGS